MPNNYPHQTLASLKEAIDRGDYKDRYVEITIDNDSVQAKAWPLDADGKPNFGDDETDDWPDPDYLANLGGGSPRDALKEALELLGFKNVEFA